MLYTFIFKVFFAKLDPEFAHHLVATGMRVAAALRLTRLGSLKPSSTKSVSAMGLNFSGAFGVAAGFDKHAILVRALGDLGFSHVEIGTVTAKPQPGNPKPRLFRLVPDRALINRMGFNNEGAEAIAVRLERLRKRHGAKLPVIGVNIGKSKVTEVENAVDDYRYSAKKLAPFADYLAVNVSSPNTPGLRSLQDVAALRPILVAVIEESMGKPVLVKIAPDLADEDVVAVAELSNELQLAGVISTNTTVGRTGLTAPEAAISAIGAGGLSGAPLKSRSIEVLKLLKASLASNQVIVSVGGIETADEAQERLDLGATLVQGYTGFVYAGPFWARKINRLLH
ncbi:MAG: quinone-dependent dihydroorotate dehydrogenase [Microbacteriaceae bacterium]|nr:quinone-dependent dihydroorotate dehydrogenase [Microbacteriaceae bacterium]